MSTHFFHPITTREHSLDTELVPHQELVKQVTNSILNIEQTGIFALFTDVLCYVDHASDLMGRFYFFKLHTLWALLMSLVSTKAVKLGNNRACSRTKQGYKDHTGKNLTWPARSKFGQFSLSLFSNYGKITGAIVCSSKSQAQTDHILSV